MAIRHAEIKFTGLGDTHSAEKRRKLTKSRRASGSCRNCRRFFSDSQCTIGDSPESDGGMAPSIIALSNRIVGVCDRHASRHVEGFVLAEHLPDFIYPEINLVQYNVRTYNAHYYCIVSQTQRTTYAYVQ